MYDSGETVTPQDKSKLFSVMETLRIAVLPKIYGPQIIPKRQCTFPTAGFLWFNQLPSPCGHVRSGRRSHILPEVSARWGPRKAPAHGKHSTNVFSVCLPSGSTKGQGGGPLLLIPPVGSQFQPQAPGAGVEAPAPSPSSTKNAFTLEQENQITLP